MGVKYPIIGTSVLVVPPVIVNRYSVDNKGTIVFLAILILYCIFKIFASYVAVLIVLCPSAGGVNV